MTKEVSNSETNIRIELTISPIDSSDLVSIGNRRLGPPPLTEMRRRLVNLPLPEREIKRPTSKASDAEMRHRCLSCIPFIL